MSGGYFNYNQYILIDMINKLDERKKRIKDYGKDIDVLTIDKSTEDLIEDAKVIAKLAQIFIHRVDWLLSGDDGPETFKERIKEDLSKAGFLYYGTNSTSFSDRKVYGFSKKIEQ
jgi:hypothetical protein